MVAVETFVENFKSGFDKEYLENVFTNGNCYHFSLILKSMYNGTIVYDPHGSHFLTKIDGNYYDITGKVERPMDEYPWDEMEDIDCNEYALVVDNCVYKV